MSTTVVRKWVGVEALVSRRYVHCPSCACFGRSATRRLAVQNIIFSLSPALLPSLPPSLPSRIAHIFDVGVGAAVSGVCAVVETEDATAGVAMERQKIWSGYTRIERKRKTEGLSSRQQGYELGGGQGRGGHDKPPVKPAGNVKLEKWYA